MTNYGKVRSTVKPAPMVVDDYSVWLHSNIEAVSENVGEDNEFIGFEFDMIQYDKNEFIKKQAEDNFELSSKLVDTELALCEIYEMLD